ncbi:MAG: hypothetical protein Q7U88_01770 [Desulfocapsaceae bacterium]|nr:hypothetical protein [Desulfocapsaceae bacterium]
MTDPQSRQPSAYKKKMTLARYQQESIPVLTTARDRINAREMSLCTFGSGGTCCRICNMSPCQIIDGVETMIGVCGATSDTVAARNFARIVGAGVALQVEEARDMVRVSIFSQTEGIIMCMIKKAGNVASNSTVTPIQALPSAIGTARPPGAGR